MTQMNTIEMHHGSACNNNKKTPSEGKLSINVEVANACRLFYTVVSARRQLGIHISRQLPRLNESTAPVD